MDKGRDNNARPFFYKVKDGCSWCFCGINLIYCQKFRLRTLPLPSPQLYKKGIHDLSPLNFQPKAEEILVRGRKKSFYLFSGSYYIIFDSIISF
jgi:hypothetical protein